jgi:hypothetical protein
MVISRKLYAALAVPALTLAACGGGGGNSDKDDITQIIKDGGKTPASLCEHMTDRLLKQIGGADACTAASKSDGTPDANIKVDSLKIDGDKATATITDKTGKNTAKFVKTGDEWQLDG